MKYYQENTASIKKRTSIVNLAEEIANNTNKPMSILEILEKYAPPFPFEVRKVRCIPSIGVKRVLSVGQVVAISGPSKENPGSFSLGETHYVLCDLRQWVLV